MVSWLQKKGVPCDLSMRKITLTELIEKNKPNKKQYAINSLFEHYGHTVLRLPPYMCELNPIELAWLKVKSNVRKNNVTGNLNLAALKELTEKAIDAVTAEDWRGYVHHVMVIEDTFWEKDGILENAVDEVIIKLGQCESDEDDSSSTTSLSSSTSSNVSLDTSDLAVPLEQI